LAEVNFVAPKSGWIVGRGGAILHTEDGGRTWSQQKSGTDALLESVTIVRPYGAIGVQLKDVPNAAVAPAHVVSYSTTVLNVVPGAPADEAGLKTGDIIVALNGKQVKSSGEMLTEVFALKPGTDAKLDYVRNGKDGTTDVRIVDGSNSFASQARR
jgi:serine protease Do